MNIESIAVTEERGRLKIDADFCRKYLHSPLDIASGNSLFFFFEDLDCTGACCSAFFSGVRDHGIVMLTQQIVDRFINVIVIVP